MDDEPLSAAALDRLRRIGTCDRRDAPPGRLVAELRSLLRDADLPVTSVKDGEEVVERLHTAPHGT